MITATIEIDLDDWDDASDEEVREVALDSILYQIEMDREHTQVKLVRRGDR